MLNIMNENEKRIELLSPAGSFEALTAAVQNGADAVYLGGSEFNARRSAANFDEDGMRRALDYCHLRDVRVFVTFNTLILDRELQAALDYAGFLYESGADALIVQDLGLVRMLRGSYPDFPLHASTQMGVHDLDGVRILKELGFKRAVLSRETPLSEIKAIHMGCGLPLECFAHGAMCVSFSGGCLFSSMVGGRSGNRGTCAQPCRKKIAAGSEPMDKYGLSMADLCMLTHIGDLRDAGVSSIKLEGRLKRAEYVAVVTRAYRRALDGAPQKELESEFQRVKEIFSRGGFTTGYYYSRNDIKTGCRAENSPSSALLEDAAASYSEENRKSPCSIRLTLRVGEHAKLVMKCSGEEISVTGPVTEKAIKPQESSRYALQLKKLGGTVFLAESVCADSPEDAFIAVSELNELRRSAVQMISERLISRYKRAKPADIRSPLAETGELKKNRTASPLISAKVRTAEQAAAAYEAGAEEVVLDPADYKNIPFEELERIKNGRRLILSLPAVVLSGKERVTLLNALLRPVWDGAAVNNIGRLCMAKGLPAIIAEAPMNAFNREAVKMLLELGCTRVMLSPELTKAQLRDIIDANGACAVTVYGRVPLMHLMHCPVKLDRGCENCGGSARGMTDQEGRTFPLVNTRQSDGCLVRLLNCVPTDLTGVYQELPSPQSIRLDFFSESPDEIKERIHAARICGPAIPESTRGHWNRGVL
jgi:putative protease